MKKRNLILLLSLIASLVHGQSIYLDTGNIKALIPSSPQLFWDGVGAASFVVPKSGSNSTVFTSTPWMSAKVGSMLYLSGELYRQNGTDYQHGPVANSYGGGNWGVLKLNRSMIEQFKSTPSQWANPPAAIANWPAHGDTTNGMAWHLAPFVNVGGSPDVYEPQLGDYPGINGDQYTYYIFNDDKTHTETGGAPMKIELHRSAWVYADTSSFLNNALFVSYQVFNRSVNTYDSVIFSVYTDFDIGFYNDDYVGTDSVLNMVYGYNGLISDSKYGMNPPATGMMLLNKPMTSSMYYTNDNTVMGNPSNASGYNMLMHATWLDNTTMTYGDSGYGGASRAWYSYSGNPCSGNGWTEAGSGRMAGDRRILANIAMPSLAPHASFKVTFAYLYAKGSNGPSSSICALKDDADKLKDWYLNFMGVASAPLTKNQPNVLIYPNPSAGITNIQCEHMTKAEVRDITGRIMYTEYGCNTLTIPKLAAGVYVVTVYTPEGQASTRLISE